MSLASTTRFLSCAPSRVASTTCRSGGRRCWDESSRPGIFAVGDVRSGFVKRVAAAIGEGSMAVRLVFERVRAGAIASANLVHAEALPASA